MSAEVFISYAAKDRERVALLVEGLQKAGVSVWIDMAGIDPARAVFFEDDPRNLRVPHRLGMRTVLVGPGRHGPNDSAPEAEIGNHIDHRIGDLEAFLCRIVPGQPPGQNGGRDRNVRGRRCR